MGLGSGTKIPTAFMKDNSSKIISMGKELNTSKMEAFYKAYLLMVRFQKGFITILEDKSSNSIAR